MYGKITKHENHKSSRNITVPWMVWVLEQEHVEGVSLTLLLANS